MKIRVIGMFWRVGTLWITNFQAGQSVTVTSGVDPFSDLGGLNLGTRETRLRSRADLVAIPTDRRLRLKFFNTSAFGLPDDHLATSVRHSSGSRVPVVGICRSSKTYNSLRGYVSSFDLRHSIRLFSEVQVESHEYGKPPRTKQKSLYLQEKQAQASRIRKNGEPVRVRSSESIVAKARRRDIPSVLASGNPSRNRETELEA